MSSCGLNTHDLHLLDQACKPIRATFGHGLYLVGTAATGPVYRDVDVRMMLTDEEFDSLFADRRALWGLLCFTISHYLRSVTGLPVDFQIQRQTEANAKHNGMRNPIGSGREFAAGGDATPFAEAFAAQWPEVDD